MTKLLSIVVFLACCCGQGTAQEYRAFARRYSIEEGLPHRQVNDLLQDRRGFIWAATNGGIVRFDGRRFQVLNQSENGLGGDIVDWLAEDANGYIWAYRIGPAGWLNIIEPLSCTLVPVAEYFKNYPLQKKPENWFGAPHTWSDGTLLLCSADSAQVLQFHPARGWKQMPVPQGRFFSLVKATSRQTMWGFHVDGQERSSLMEVDARGHILYRIWTEDQQLFWPTEGETGDPDGFFVLERGASADYSLFEIDGQGNQKPAVSHSPFYQPRQFARLENGQIEVDFPLISDRSGRLLIDLRTPFPELDPFQYCDYLRDKNGNIWIATTFGLIVIELRKNYFRRLLFDAHAQGGRGKACRGLLELDGHLMVNAEGYNQGRFLINLKTGFPERLTGTAGIALGRSADGTVWTHLDTLGAGYWNLSLQKTTAAGQPIGPRFQQKRPAGLIFAILEESPQRVLLGHVNGLSIYNPQTRTAEPWHDTAFPAINTASVHGLQKDRQGQLWACTEQGLFRLKAGGGVAERYWLEGQGHFYLPYNNILHFYEDSDGICWLSTSGSGLIRWDRSAPPGQQTQVLFRKSGLLNGVVYAAYEDQHEHLWLPTDYGIVQLDKKNKQVRRTWLTSDGLTHNEFNRISHCQGADGALYFGGLNGVTAFNPDDFYTHTDLQKSKIPLVVSNFNVLDAGSGQLENRTAELVRTNQFTIYPDDRYIQLEFALLDYVAPEKVIYTWKLETHGGDWENLKEPVLRLSSLPFGRQRLRVRAQAADGSWAANELSIELRVLPPVYQRWWFLLSALLLLLAGLWAWYLWRTRAHRLEQERLETEVARQTATIRHQTEELKKLDEAKSRFFANVSHELRTPLTLVLGPLSSLLKGKRLDPRDAAQAQSAQQHGRQLLQLVNEILDLSKMESGKMTLYETAVSCQPFMRRLVSAFESHAERHGILFVFEYALPDRLRLLVDEDKLQKVLNNLLSNALKFTPPHAGGAITTRVSASEANIRISVQDTGRGIHPNDLPYVFERFYQSSQPEAPVEGGTGIGLALCREFAAVMQGRIWVESTLGQGSTFYFEFPKKEVLGTGDTYVPDPEDLAAAIGEPRPQPVPAPALPAGQPAHTILLVEDNDSLRDYVQSILAEKYRVVTAENGQMAWQRLLECQPGASPNGQPVPGLPELILSDVMMPVMDGFQLLEKLKSDDRYRHIPVVMLTARADLRDKLRALRIGVDDYLLKPFEEDELLARVDNLLRNYRARAQPADDLPPETPGDAMAEEAAPALKTVSREQQEWLERLETMVADHLGDSRLSADWLAYGLFTGRNLFYKKVKQLTGMTPNEYIQEVRLTQARQLLETGACQSVKEASYTVGVKDVKYFSEQFKKRFGKSPSAYRG